MSGIFARAQLKWLIPIALVSVLGCGMANRISVMLSTPTPVPTVTSLPSPTATVTAVATEVQVAMAPTQTPPSAVTPEKVPPPTVEATAEITATATLTPTPTPTPGPLSFYLSRLSPECPQDGARAEISVIDDKGQAVPGVTLNLLNGAATPISEHDTDEQGKASLPVGEHADEGWMVEISDDDGGSVPARMVRVSRPELGCEPPYSVEIEFQNNVPKKEVTMWPERQPITMAYPPRIQKEGPWSPDHVRPLSDWPRPPHDNGMGIHFLPIGYYADWVVDLLIEHMKEMHMTWCVVLYNDDLALRIAAERFRDAGIMVVWRPNISPDASYIYMERDVQILQEIGMPPYIQIFNEPEVTQEWGDGDGEIRIKRFADNWMKFGDTVYNAGGFPGLQLVDPDTLPYLIDRIREKGKEYLFDEMFFVAHPYGSNHPPDYPYDANMQSREPGKTVDDDWFGTLGFLKYAHIFQEKLGFVPPIIIGEGGWTVTVREDDKYPPVGFEAHRDWHTEVFSWFKNNSLSDGEALPDYLFSFNPWIIASGGEMVFDQASWYQSEQSGTKSMTIKALERIPPFERKSSWN